MCQVNTDPMRSQVAWLDVMVPPEITRSSADQETREGDTAKLECHSDGYPRPRISWRREGQKAIKAIGRRGSVKTCMLKGLFFVADHW